MTPDAIGAAISLAANQLPWPKNSPRLRKPFRWRQIVALVRVTASEFGRPAPGVAEARERLGIARDHTPTTRC